MKQICGVQMLWHTVACTLHSGEKKSHTLTCRTTASFDDGTFSPYLFSCRVSIILRVLMMGESYCCVKSSPSERFRVGLTSRLCRGQCEYDPLSSLFRESLFHNLSPLNLQFNRGHLPHLRR